jgi:PAS domain S-box-containing protein
MNNRARPEQFGIGRLFEHVRDAVIVADAGSERILLWNKGATEMFGYAAAEALELPLHALVAPELVDRHRAGLARYAAEGTGDLVDSGKSYELEALRNDGSKFFVELTLTSVAEPSPGGGRAVMALIRDASDRKAAEKWRTAELSQKRALELHDSVVQLLVVSKAYFDLDDDEAGRAAVEKALQKARAMVGQMMEERESLFGLRPGDFVRSEPASSEPLSSEPDETP